MTEEQRIKLMEQSLCSFPPLQHVLLPFEVKSENVDAITYIGFYFRPDSAISSKVYYRPDTDYTRIIKQSVGEAGRFFVRNNAKFLETGACLYDFSFETMAQDEPCLRAVWHLPMRARLSKSALKEWFGDFLSTLHFSGVLDTNLNIESYVRAYNGSALSPIFLVGGYFDNSGDLIKLKVNYDMDVVKAGEENLKRNLVYDNASVIKSFASIFPQYLPGHDADRWAYFAGQIVESGYHLVTYGLHFSQQRLEEFKIYFRTTDEERVLGQRFIKDAFEATGIDGYDDFMTLTSYYLEMGWKYTGFNIAFLSGQRVDIKFYMQR